MLAITIPVLLVQSVFAAEGKWIDKNNILVDGKKYTDIEPSHSSPIFCGPLKGDAPPGATEPTTRAECFDSGRFTLCNDYVARDTVSANKETAKLQKLRRAGGNCANDGAAETITFDRSTIANATSASGEEGEGGATGGDIDPTTNDVSPSPEAIDGTSCESAGPFGWLFCPIINMLDLFLQFLDKSVQGLLSIDDGKYRDNDLKETWAAIRNIAYIILIPVMLVMVIGTALGFSAVDAYTVKKALPRLVIAVMFIALSWEIAGFFIKMSNEIGSGVLGLMTTPLGLADAGRDGLTLQDMFSGTFSGGTIVQGTAILGIGFAAYTPGVMALVFSFLTTASLIMLTALLVLIARQLFILAIMVFLPLGIIAWIFPGNDKLWKLVWGTFTKLLIMFPLITALIGVGRVFAFIVGNAITDNSAGLEGAVLNPILKVVAYIIPYALIPYTFKAAGGVFGNLVGMANDREKGLFDRIRKGRQPKIERVGRQAVQRRADWQNRLQKSASSGSRYNPLRYGQKKLAGAVGGYNIQAADSARRTHVQKEINDQIAAGRDDEVRGLTVNKKSSESRTHEGRRQFRTLGGAWVDEAVVDAGRQRWGKDTYAQQAALSYEMRKAGTEEELQHVAKHYQSVAKDTWGMSDNAAAGAWIGAAFENQNQNLQFKHTSWDGGGGPMGLNQAQKYISEVYEKKGSYPLSQMSSQSIQKLKEAHSIVSGAGDINSRRRAQSIAETFMHELGGGGQIGVGPNDEPVNAPGGGAGRRMVSTPGAAHVAERVREFAEQAGARIGEPTGEYVPDQKYYGDQGYQNREHK